MPQLLSKMSSEKPQINSIFLDAITEHFPHSNILNLLKCHLCRGVLRYPFTLTTCTHSFCRECIFAYINHNHNHSNYLQCPDCGQQQALQNGYDSVIVKDVLKQRIVDNIFQEYRQRDQRVLKQVETALGCNLQVLVGVDVDTAIRNQQKSREGEFLSEHVSSISSILKSNYRHQLVQLGSSDGNYQMPPLISIEPRSDKDFEAVGLKGKMKLLSDNVDILRGFVEYRMLQKCKERNKYPQDLKYTIILSLRGKPLQNMSQIFKCDNIDRTVMYGVDPKDD